jgi:hypothetical protein
MKRSVAIGICAIGLTAMTAGALADDHASKNGWRFHNFSDPTLSWDIYRDTFIGIPASEDPVASPFDALFYEQVYKSKLAAPGNCFGMSLLSLMILQNGGHLGYCAPVTQYSGDPNATGMGPSDPLLHRAINVMHGHQVNLPTLQFLLDVFTQHNNRDAQHAYDQFNYWQSRGDLTGPMTVAAGSQKGDLPAGVPADHPRVSGLDARRLQQPSHVFDQRNLHRILLHSFARPGKPCFVSSSCSS